MEFFDPRPRYSTPKHGHSIGAQVEEHKLAYLARMAHAEISKISENQRTPEDRETHGI